MSASHSIILSKQIFDREFPFYWNDESVAVQVINTQTKLINKLQSYESKLQNSSAEDMKIYIEHLSEQAFGHGYKNPLAAVINFSFARIHLTGTNLIDSLNYTGLFYSAIYQYFYDKEFVGLSHLYAQLLNKASIKEIALVTLNEANKLINDSKHLEKFKVEKLLAANLFATAEVYAADKNYILAEQYYSAAENCLVRAGANFKDINKIETKQLARVKTRLAFMLRSQNTIESVMKGNNMLESVNKDYWQYKSDGLDVAQFNEKFGKYLIKTHRYALAIKRFESAMQFYLQEQFQHPYNFEKPANNYSANIELLKIAIETCKNKAKPSYTLQKSTTQLDSINGNFQQSSEVKSTEPAEASQQKPKKPILSSLTNLFKSKPKETPVSEKQSLINNATYSAPSSKGGYGTL